MIKLMQSWTHIENKTKLSDGILFKIIVEFYTDEQFIPFEIYGNYVQLRIKSRYENKELEYMVNEDEMIEINLGDFREWPVSKEDEYLRDVKIEVSYIITDINLYRYKFPKSIYKTGFEAYFSIILISQGEFSLTLPLGYKLEKINGENLELIIMVEENGLKKYNFLSFEKNNFIDYVNEKISYTFLLDKKSLNYLINSFNKNNQKNIKILMHYKVKNETKYWALTMFPFLLICIGIINFFIPLFHDFNFSIIGIFIAFLTFYYYITKQGYEIPWNRTIVMNTILSGILLCFTTIYKFPTF
jgi:hypothetical protein